MKTFKDMPFGEWFVGKSTYSETEYAFYRISEHRHLECSLLYSDNHTSEMSTLTPDLKYEVIDWFEENSASSGNCTCSIPQLMGGGCICGSISRYKS